MAEGGENGDINPFSFKKFIKSKNRDKSSGESDTGDSEEENAVDLLENSLGQNRSIILLFCTTSCIS